MKTINQIKDCQAIDLGYNSFRDLVINPKKDMQMHHLTLCIERSMEEYADQFKPKWIDPDQINLFNETPSERIVVLFDTGEMLRWDEQHPLALIVGFFVLPTATEREGLEV